MTALSRQTSRILLAIMAVGLAGCAPYVVQDTANPCTPPRRVFTARAANYMDLASTAPVPAPPAASLLLHRVNQVIGERDNDFDRLYAQTSSLDHLDRAASDEMSARLAQVMALASSWHDLATCRRTQATAQPTGQANQPARLRHEEDLRALRQTEEATVNWRRRYERLQHRIAEMAPSGTARGQLASAAQLHTFSLGARTYAQAVAEARNEAATHFTPK